MAEVFTSESKLYVCRGRCPHRPLRVSENRTPCEFHTSNIQRAQTKRLVRRVVRSGNPILRPPEGRSLPGALSVNGTQKQSAFSGATAPFASPAPLFSPFFSGKTEKNGPPEAFRTGWCRKMSRRRHTTPFRRRKDMARGAAATALQTAVRLRRIRNDLLEAERLYTALPSLGCI